MDVLTTAALEAALAVRLRLVAQAGAARVAELALDAVRAQLPVGDPPSWRGEAARAEVARTRALASELEAASAQLRDVAQRLGRDVWAVDVHVG